MTVKSTYYNKFLGTVFRLLRRCAFSSPLFTTLTAILLCRDIPIADISDFVKLCYRPIYIYSYGEPITAFDPMPSQIPVFFPAAKHNSIATRTRTPTPTITTSTNHISISALYSTQIIEDPSTYDTNTRSSSNSVKNNNTNNDSSDSNTATSSSSDTNTIDANNSNHGSNNSSNNITLPFIQPITSAPHVNQMHSTQLPLTGASLFSNATASTDLFFANLFASYTTTTSLAPSFPRTDNGEGFKSVSAFSAYDILPTDTKVDHEEKTTRNNGFAAFLPNGDYNNVASNANTTCTSVSDTAASTTPFSYPPTDSNDAAITTSEPGSIITVTETNTANTAANTNTTRKATTTVNTTLSTNNITTADNTTNNIATNTTTTIGTNTYNTVSRTTSLGAASSFMVKTSFSNPHSSNPTVNNSNTNNTISNITNEAAPSITGLYTTGGKNTSLWDSENSTECEPFDLLLENDEYIIGYEDIIVYEPQAHTKTCNLNRTDIIPQSCLYYSPAISPKCEEVEETAESECVAEDVFIRERYDCPTRYNKRICVDIPYTEIGVCTGRVTKRVSYSCKKVVEYDDCEYIEKEVDDKCIVREIEQAPYNCSVPVRSSYCEVKIESYNDKCNRTYIYDEVYTEYVNATSTKCVAELVEYKDNCTKTELTEFEYNCSEVVYEKICGNTNCINRGKGLYEDNEEVRPSQKIYKRRLDPLDDDNIVRRRPTDLETSSDAAHLRQPVLPDILDDNDFTSDFKASERTGDNKDRGKYHDSLSNLALDNPASMKTPTATTKNTAVIDKKIVASTTTKTTASSTGPSSSVNNIEPSLDHSTSQIKADTPLRTTHKDSSRQVRLADSIAHKYPLKNRLHNSSVSRSFGNKTIENTCNRCRLEEVSKPSICKGHKQVSSTYECIRYKMEERCKPVLNTVAEIKTRESSRVEEYECHIHKPTREECIDTPALKPTVCYANLFKTSVKNCKKKLSSHVCTKKSKIVWGACYKYDTTLEEYPCYKTKYREKCTSLPTYDVTYKGCYVDIKYTRHQSNCKDTVSRREVCHPSSPTPYKCNAVSFHSETAKCSAIESKPKCIRYPIISGPYKIRDASI